MIRISWRGIIVLGLMASLAACGCGQGGDRQKGAGEKPREAKAENKSSEGCSGWWCEEHGVPEEECAQCNSKLAAELKKKGDWCQEHDRPRSQCFLCEPKLKEKFAQRFRDKYGTEPPAPKN